MRHVFFLLVLLTASASLEAQERPESSEAMHTVPVGVSGNAVEVSVQNVSSGEALRGARVLLVSAPAWALVTPDAVALADIDPRTSGTAAFSFDVSPDAPVGAVGEIVFSVESRAGSALGARTVRLTASAPEALALAPPRPNPATDEAWITYALPTSSNVTLGLFDALGRRVWALAPGVVEAGHHEVALPTGAVAPGVYVIRLVTQNAGQTQSLIRRLTVVR